MQFSNKSIHIVVQSLELDHLAKPKLCIIKQFPFLLSPCQPLFYFLYLWVWLFYVSYRSGIKQDLSFFNLSFWMAYFTWHNALKVNPCHSMCQNFLPFWGRETFQCVNTPYFFFPGHSSDVYLGCLHLLTIVYNAAMNMSVHVFPWDAYFNSLGCLPGIGIA